MNEDKKKKYMGELLYTLGYYSYSSYINYFDLLPEIQQQDYCRCFMVAFCNYYIKSQTTPSSKLIGYDDFFNGWSSFISKLKNFNNEKCLKTMNLKLLCCNNEVSYDNQDSKKNKPKRFWDKYVCYCPTSKSAIVPPISSHKGIYQQELPFYYILYTIYYYSNKDNLIDYYSTFDNFQMLFADNKTVRYFNTLLRWCVACYTEWYSFCSIQEFLDTEEDFSYYITGIPYILENFGFFWHIGMEWLNVCLKETLDTYNYNFLADKLFSFSNKNYTDFIWDLFSTHRLWTKPYITGEDSLRSPRHNEKQRLFKEYTNYIQTYLDKYFQYQSNRIDIDSSFKYTTDDEEITSIDYTFENILAFTQENIKDFFSSIFLCFADSCNENDLLPYINLHIFFNWFVNFFNSFEVEETLSNISFETFIDTISSFISFNHKKDESRLCDLYDFLSKSKNSEEFSSLMSLLFDLGEDIDENIDENIDYSKIYNTIIINHNLEIFTTQLQALVLYHKNLKYTEIYENNIMKLFSEIKKNALVTDTDIDNYIYKMYLDFICTKDIT